MSNIDTLESRLDVDAYCKAYDARVEAGTVTPLDRANTAVRVAEQSAAILLGDREGCPVEIRIEAAMKYKRARGAARLAAKLQAAKHEAGASRAADVCEAAALSIEQMDSARFEGLTRPKALDAFGDRQREAGRARKH